ncbi:MAG: hypothetical protein WCT32_05085 [Patescibacteria group bacterium]|jgi:hypothetical protein
MQVKPLEFVAEDLDQEMTLAYCQPNGMIIHLDGLPAFKQFANYFPDETVSRRGCYRPAKIEVNRGDSVLSVASIHHSETSPIKLMFFGFSEINPKKDGIQATDFLPALWLQPGDRVIVEVTQTGNPLFDRSFGAFLAWELILRRTRRWLENNAVPQDYDDILTKAESLKAIGELTHRCHLRFAGYNS